MLGILVSAVVDSAPCDNHHVGAFADEEIVVDDLLQAAFRHHYRDVYTLIFGSGPDPDLQSADILFGCDLDVCGGAASRGLAVGPDIVSAFRHFMQVRHFQQQPFLNLVHQASSSLSRMVFIRRSQAGASALSAPSEG